ncbi:MULTISPECIES: GIY-YIG nuclease family protein [Vibrio harveyi group]|uniref:GIY-YIG nuclease family protein n=1 Tax=Vibrio harveyi group TaxID=717610 RepID=UPI0003FF193C|nr:MULTISPECIES: GIY-YIG nuclease family protein [Vibrio harveyi group]MDF4750595.1 GIY-YIG nuclease family protein [Vibrio parahaemolyticus]
MNEKHSIVYVMRHIDIGQNVDIPYKKVGITGLGNATLSNRLTQISNTKSPIKAQCIAAWEHEDARKVESALHQLLEDSRVEGEWFLDKDDTLAERMQAIMELLGAKSIEIANDNDQYTKQIIERESETQLVHNQALLGEINALIDKPLKTSIRKKGVTFASSSSQLTYYINYRKSGKHSFRVGRSQEAYEELAKLLGNSGYDCERNTDGEVKILGVSSIHIAELINSIEMNIT